jgi:transcriptional regulator GlxA family with amidase domain
VNSYRVDELKKVLIENPDFTIDMLSEKCGFGSAISLKRAVHAKTGKSLNEWKKQIENTIQYSK